MYLLDTHLDCFTFKKNDIPKLKHRFGQTLKKWQISEKLFSFIIM